jgi:hypothetical protein
MARQKGLEPLTHGLEGRCSVHLSYWRVKSGRADLNGRPPAPKAGALPGCATPRALKRYHSQNRLSTIILDSSSSASRCAHQMSSQSLFIGAFSERLGTAFEFMQRHRDSCIRHSPFASCKSISMHEKI